LPTAWRLRAYTKSLQNPDRRAAEKKRVFVMSGAATQLAADQSRRPRTSADNEIPTCRGDSLGKWDGGTHGHSKYFPVRECFTRNDFGHTQLAVTIIDPKTLTCPPQSAARRNLAEEPHTNRNWGNHRGFRSRPNKARASL
jgi:hypothetical protein